jgi:hypothetical protein
MCYLAAAYSPTKTSRTSYFGLEFNGLAASASATGVGVLSKSFSCSAGSFFNSLARTGGLQDEHVHRSELLITGRQDNWDVVAGDYVHTKPLGSRSVCAPRGGSHSLLSCRGSLADIYGGTVRTERLADLDH